MISSAGRMRERLSLLRSVPVRPWKGLWRPRRRRGLVPLKARLRRSDRSTACSCGWVDCRADPHVAPGTAPGSSAIRAMIVGEINRQFAMQIERIKSGEILGPFPPKTGTKDLIPTDLAPPSCRNCMGGGD